MLQTSSLSSTGSGEAEETRLLTNGVRQRAMAKTDILLFEGRPEAVDKNKFLNLNLETPDVFRRSPASWE